MTNLTKYEMETVVILSIVNISIVTFRFSELQKF